MKVFKKVLDIFIGSAALVLIAGLILYILNIEYRFVDVLIFYDALKYALPILIAIVCIRFTIDKTVWLIITIVFVSVALWIYFDPGFFSYMHSIFG